MHLDSFELVDNINYGNHHEALKWLRDHFTGSLSVATGYVGLDGLDKLSGLAENRSHYTRLLIGTTPEAFHSSKENTVLDCFEQSILSLRRERDFFAFPIDRRNIIDRITRFVESENVTVRRYVKRFLHGKAYIIGDLNNKKKSQKPSAALVSSANLTQGGLVKNLELGMIQYQPNIVGMALKWYERLWDDAIDYRDELLELLKPPLLDSDPMTIFLRALLEIYGHELDDNTSPEEQQTLTAFQLDGFIRAKRILDRYDGVLYADGVGMGKTEVGIRFIREQAQELGQHVLVISPAQLRGRLWEQRLSEENLPGTVVSYQQLALDCQLTSDSDRRVLPVNKDVYRFVVIDEAHAYRNVDNKWYASLDRLLGGTPKKLLLLTATPVNNSLWDLHHLFLLFCRHDSAFEGEPLRIPSLRKFFTEAGASSSEKLSETKLFPLIDALTVRRDRSFIQKQYRNEQFEDGTPVKFPEPKLKEYRYDLEKVHPGIVQVVHRGIDGLKMARYRLSAYRLDLPGESASEEALAGLMLSQLLKRFESSWYAALQTVNRLRDGYEVMLRVMKERGVVLPSEIIKDLVGDSGVDDSFLSIELIDEALAGAEGGLSADMFNVQFMLDLKKDRDILADISTQLEYLKTGSDPKLDTLREVMASTQSQKIAVFTAFQDTAFYLKEQIENSPDLLNGRSWTAVIGSETSADERIRELERFCPMSVRNERDFQPKGGEVDVIISTDILSEGQNLQQAQAVLSFDMPWNPQRVVQRNGRIIRLRSPHDTAYLYTLLPQQGDLDRLLKLEAKLKAKIMAVNASVGMETPVLADVKTVSRVYRDLNSFVERLTGGDITLLDDSEHSDESSSSYAGEFFRALLRRKLEEGEIKILKELPWGIGSAFVQRSPTLKETAVFFACQTRQDERYWRTVTQSGDVLLRDDLPMLQLIDPQGQSECSIPEDVDLERLFSLVAADIVRTHNALLDPEKRFAALPASQRWALDILRSPDAPAGSDYDEGDKALSVGRNALVKRELSELRRKYQNGELSVKDCAEQIVKTVKRFGLRPVRQSRMPKQINEEDLGVVCYQVIIPS